MKTDKTALLLALATAVFAQSGCKSKEGQFCRSDSDCRDNLTCSVGTDGDSGGGECVVDPEQEDGVVSMEDPPMLMDMSSKRDLGSGDDTEEETATDDSGTGTGSGTGTATATGTGTGTTGDSGTGSSGGSDSGTGESSDSSSDTEDSSTSTSGDSSTTGDARGIAPSPPASRARPWWRPL